MFLFEHLMEQQPMLIKRNLVVRELQLLELEPGLLELALKLEQLKFELIIMVCLC